MKGKKVDVNVDPDQPGDQTTDQCNAFPFSPKPASYSFFPANKMVKIIIAITAMNAIKGTAM